MQFLRTVFWVLIAVLAALFSYSNWKPVDINLWAGLVWSPPLPFPLIAAFLLGLVPTFILHRATRWSLTRRLDAMKRSLSEATAPAVIVPDTTQIGDA